MKLKATLSFMIILSVVLTINTLRVASQDDGGIVSPSSIQAPAGTAVTYQGRLEDNGTNASGQYDLQFALYDAVTSGSQVGSTITKADVTVTDGLFTTLLDFGANAFTGEERYLEIRVRPGASSGGYETLSPRQALTAVPYALNLSPNSDLVAQTAQIGEPDYFVSIGNSSSTYFQPTVRGYGRGSVANSLLLLANARAEDDTGSNPLVRVSGRVDNGPVANRPVFAVSNVAQDILTVDADSQVGINKVPGAALDVLANSTTAGGWNEAIRLGPNSQAAMTHPGGGLLFGLHGINRTFYFADIENGAFQKYVMTINANNGRVAIGHLNPQALLDVAGTTRTNILQIDGGSDLSESFDVNAAAMTEPEPGMVVCIDDKNPGELVVCDKAYDFTVAGAVSGAGGINPGMVMGQEGTIAAGEHPVALTGRVYVLVDAGYGAVQPGDLLTTSDTPGHAMKVTEYDAAQGAIIGKAMTSLEFGRGLVLVLVTLQ